MSANLTPAQQSVAEKVARKAQEDPTFRARLAENEGEALSAAGLLDDYAAAFSDEVSGYVEAVAIEDGSTCCVSNVSGSCCFTCWFSMF